MIGEVKIPELVEVWRIARLIGWTTAKTRRFFVDAGLASRIGKNTEWMVVRVDFEVVMPTLYRIFAESYARGELLSRRGRWSRETKTSEDEINKVTRIA